MRFFVYLIFVCVPQISMAQVWVADQGNGTYQNPVIHADYSDPDVCRVGEDFYMVSSSFDAVPGIPILHSKDLVNWTIIGHALNRQVPVEHFETTKQGNGVWAPSIRYHNSEFYIYYPDPDFGIYLIKAKKPEGPWSAPVLVEAGKGLIDPCPLWDDDGRLYLVHAYAGSRAGIKSVIVVKELNAEGTKVINEGKLVYDGHELDPTIEGPKFYKRNRYYYIFAPAGGVSTGWQTVLRSKHVYGPYERKVVLDQGNTTVNGPHQGAWVTTENNEDWFIHFQDKEAYGRVVHLQPMQWINDWPVIGMDKDGDGKGEPVLSFRKPAIKTKLPIATPVEGDEFNNSQINLAWQWHANPQATWAFVNTAKGTLRLYATKQKQEIENLWDVPNILFQKIPGEAFHAVVKLTFVPNAKNKSEKTGFVLMGSDYAALTLKQSENGIVLVYTACQKADKDSQEEETIITTLPTGEVYLKINIDRGALASFSYSLDGNLFKEVSKNFQAKPGKWVGAKLGLYCLRADDTNDAGFVDIDWLRLTKN
ncbi:MAG: glycoside hydrolase [Cytophagia bacterium]|nr:glycoside hydrolase [Cytophagia bacterium]